MSGNDIRSRTVGGLLAYCDWLGRNGYQGTGAVKAWKVAINKVFQAVDGENYRDLSLDGLDLDDYVGRFRRLAEQNYKAESIDVYAARIRRATEAQLYYIEHDKAPTFKQGTSRPKGEAGEKKTQSRASSKKAAGEKNGGTVTKLPPAPDFFEFAYPLSPGRMVHMQLPMQMTKREIDRLCAVLQTLEEQPQLPERTAA